MERGINLDTSQNTSDLSFTQRRTRQFKQQQIPSVIISFSLKFINIILILSSIIFTMLGIIILLTTSNDEFHYDYTDCISSNIITEKTTCEEYLKRGALDPGLPLCFCNISLNIEKRIKSQAYMYYRILNFYQNERTYSSSIDFKQLRGDLGTLSDECDPYRTITEGSKNLNVAPCGIIANSFFNDSYSLVMKNPSRTVPMVKTGIAYSYDKRFRFKNPPNWNNTVKPPFWRKTVMELDPDNPDNNGYQNEDLIVWLRPAAFKSPRKLHRLVDHGVGPFVGGLPPGNYELNVEYNFPVSGFGGRKVIILSSGNWLGGNSLFMSVSYIVVGISSFVALISILIFSKRKK